MKLVWRAAPVVAAALALGPAVVTGAWAAPAVSLPPHGTPAEAKAMLNKVVGRVKAVGRKQAFFEFTARRPPFFDRDLYVVCIDAKRVVVAHGGFATYVGSASFFKDVNGRLMAPTILEAAARGDGVVRYTIRNEETNNTVEPKIGFFRRIKDDVCGVVAHDAP